MEKSAKKVKALYKESFYYFKSKTIQEKYCLNIGVPPSKTKYKF